MRYGKTKDSANDDEVNINVMMIIWQKQNVQSMPCCVWNSHRLSWISMAQLW